jgi:hypothetical protein
MNYVDGAPGDSMHTYFQGKVHDAYNPRSVHAQHLRAQRSRAQAHAALHMHPRCSEQVPLEIGLQQFSNIRINKYYSLDELNYEKNSCACTIRSPPLAPPLAHHLHHALLSLAPPHPPAPRALSCLRRLHFRLHHALRLVCVACASACATLVWSARLRLGCATRSGLRRLRFRLRHALRLACEAACTSACATRSVYIMMEFAPWLADPHGYRATNVCRISGLTFWRGELGAYRKLRDARSSRQASRCIGLSMARSLWRICSNGR